MAPSLLFVCSYLSKQRKKATSAVTRVAEHVARLHEAVALRTNLHRRTGFPPEGRISLDEFRSIPQAIVHDGGGGGTPSIMDRIFVRTPEFQQKNGAWCRDVVCRFCRKFLVAVYGLSILASILPG